MRLPRVIQNVTLTRIREADGAQLFSWTQPHPTLGNSLWLTGRDRTRNAKEGIVGYLQFETTLSSFRWLFHPDNTNPPTRKGQYDHYETWAIEAIRLVANEKKELGRLRFDEIRCIVNKDGHWPDAFTDGDTPETAWQDELDALADSA